MVMIALIKEITNKMVITLNVLNLKKNKLA